MFQYGVLELILKLKMKEQKFSKRHAQMLADLCARAEGSDEPICVNEEGDDVFAAIRGSGDPAEILHVRTATKAHGIAFGAGTGYGTLVDAYRRTVAGELERLHSRRVWLGGHGIGGAFALFAAIELLAQGRTVAAVYTFGAPRMGDSRLVKTITCPVFRVVNNLDVMVTMPPPWRWRHVGDQVLINEDGSLNLKPNPLNRLPSLLRQTAWLGEMLAQGLTSGYPRALNTLLNQVLGDHALESYRARLRAL